LWLCHRFFAALLHDQIPSRFVRILEEKERAPFFPYKLLEENAS